MLLTTMETHVRVLAWLNIAMGCFGLLIAAIVFLVAGSVGGLLQMVDADLVIPGAIIGIVATLIVGFILFLSLPLVIGGWGLLELRPWSRVLMIVLSALNLLHPPIGTMVGIYGLWVLLQPQTEALFRPRSFAASA